MKLLVALSVVAAAHAAALRGSTEALMQQMRAEMQAEMNPNPLLGQMQTGIYDNNQLYLKSQ